MTRQIKCPGNLVRALALVSGLVVVGQAEALDVHLTADDSATVSSFNTAGNWDVPLPPSLGNDYFTAGHVLTTPKGADIEFQGASLTLDDQIWHINQNKTTIPRLIAKEGAYIYTVNNKGPIYGCLELDSDLAFEIQDNGEVPGAPQQLNMDILGDQTSSVYYRRKKGTYAKGLRLGGDLSRFTGKIYAYQTNVVLQVAFSTLKTSFPGTLECTNGSRLEIEVADGVQATVGSIDATDVKVTLGEGATLSVAYDVNLHGNPIRVVSTHAFTAAAETVPLVNFQVMEMRASDVEFQTQEMRAAAETGLQHCPAALNLQSQIDNGTFSVSHRKVVYLTTSDTSKTTSIFSGPGEDRWSEQLDAESAAEADYYLSQKTAYHPLTTPVTFYGHSLTIAGGDSAGSVLSGTLSTVASREITIDDFRWMANGGDGVQISSYNGSITLNGNITVLSTAKDVFFGWHQWNGYTSTINSNIKGSGGIKLTLNQDAANNANSGFVLAGDNSEYTGRILLMHKPFKNGTTPAANPDNYFVTLSVAEQKNLGGALPEFDAESLSIEDNSLLQVTASAVFDEPTRGWRVRGHGRIGVPEGAVVTVNKTVTYADDGTDAGRWTKEGLGTLVLGGSAVLDGDLAKTLEVKEGALRFASTTAVDGVQVSFAAGTSLQIDFSATGDLATKGVVNANEQPFVSATADGKIPLQFTGTETLSLAETSVAICTVPSALKDSLKFDYPEAINRRAVSVTSRDNFDGTVTFFASVAAKRGLVILFN